MIRILHISADFPDAVSRRKTFAVRNLVEGTPDFQHHVYSINRISGLGGLEMCGRDGNVTTLTYRAPRYGLLLKHCLAPLADWIARDMDARGEGFDLIHAHKLTIEGLVAHRLARTVGCPYVCTVRGNTDQKYIRMKPELRRSWRQVATEAAWLFPVSPWIDRYLSQKLTLKNTNRSLLPTVTQIDRFLPPQTTTPRFVTAFHLAGWRLKGMPNLLAALARLQRAGRPIGLDILGSGSERETAALTHEIRRHNLSDLVRLCGAVPHERMPDTLNNYTAFVLPTLRETFGMVYIEALFAGVPILYSRDRGVDGFFDGQDVGLRCNPVSVTSIAEGLSGLLDNAGRMKQEIARQQTDGGLERFRLNTVCRDYTAKMTCLASGARTASENPDR